MLELEILVKERNLDGIKRLFREVVHRVEKAEQPRDISNFGASFGSGGYFHCICSDTLEARIKKLRDEADQLEKTLNEERNFR